MLSRALRSAPEALVLKDDEEEPSPTPTLADTANASCGSGFVAGNASYLIDVTKWLQTGIVHDFGDDGLADARLASARAFPSNLELQLQAHLTPKLDEVLFGSAAPSEASLQLQLSLAELPALEDTAVAAHPFVPRVSDDRVGHWQVVYKQLGTAAAAGSPLSLRRTDREVRILHKWRLDKSDPSAPLSPPLKPIRYHIDPSVPERWRASVKRGVENWNAAFEQAGFSSAVRAVLPTDDDWPPDYSSGDVRYASITWAPSVSSVYAVGPHTVDPRTGEILDADIMFAHSWIHHWVGDYDRYTRRVATHMEDAMDGTASNTEGADASTPEVEGSSRLAGRLRAAQRLVHDLLDGGDDAQGGGGHTHRGGGHAHAARGSAAGPCGAAARRLHDDVLVAA
eukprot:6200717-Prymnesium_polylepis.1